MIFFLSFFSCIQSCHRYITSTTFLLFSLFLLLVAQKFFILLLFFPFLFMNFCGLLKKSTQLLNFVFQKVFWIFLDLISWLNKHCEYSVLAIILIFILVEWFYLQSWFIQKHCFYIYLFSDLLIWILLFFILDLNLGLNIG